MKDIKTFNKSAVIVLLNKRQMKIKDFAKELGCSKSYLSQKLNERVSVTTKELENWAKVLDCQPTDFFN